MRVLCEMMDNLQVFLIEFGRLLDNVRGAVPSSSLVCLWMMSKVL